MSQKLIELAKVFQAPLRLNASAGDLVLIMTDTQMDPLLWQGLATAANCLGMEPVVTIMNPRAHHAANPASPVMHAAHDPAVDLVIFLTSTAMAHSKHTEDLVEANKKFILMEELTADMLKPGDAVLDIGAFLGGSTLLFARAVGRKGRVIAFEPVHHRFLAWMLRAMGISQARVEPIALARENGNTELVVPIHKGVPLYSQAGFAESYPEALRPGSGYAFQRLPTRLMRLDDFLHDVEPKPQAI